MTLRLPAPVLIALLLGVTAVLIGLGTWQLQRNNWKNDLVAERNARTDAAPLTIEAAQTFDLDSLDYHRLADQGEWDHERSFILANRARFQTKGEELVTPLLIAPEGPAVLVNRGWYPDGERDTVRADLEGRPDTLEGLISIHTGSARETDAGTWTAIDPEAMSAALPYELLPWIVIEGERVESTANPDGELPVQRYTAFANTTPHMEYALTWYGLAAALIAVAAIRFRPGRSGDQAPAAPSHSPATRRGVSRSPERRPEQPQRPPGSS